MSRRRSTPLVRLDDFSLFAEMAEIRSKTSETRQKGRLASMSETAFSAFVSELTPYSESTAKEVGVHPILICWICCFLFNRLTRLMCLSKSPLVISSAKTN